ncbi:hypothetical protein F4806DRAFT_447417 [Annulohypoxylon nitens]|nr:hypothetical protein F4806DRAFT_447417 [Annulohypoxylon nitens]
MIVVISLSMTPISYLGLGLCSANSDRVVGTRRVPGALEFNLINTIGTSTIALWTHKRLAASRAVINEQVTFPSRICNTHLVRRNT